MSNFDDLEMHFKVTENIISNSFINMGCPLFSIKKNDGSTTRYPLNCIGSFMWKREFKNDYSHVVIFPIFFDYLDLFIDKKFRCINKKFKEKIKIIKSKVDKSNTEDLFLFYLYDFCASLRNKIIHHRISYDGKIVRYNEKEIQISSFKFLNEIIYQYVHFGVKHKSKYETNILYSYLYHLLPDENRFRLHIKSLNNFFCFELHPNVYKFDIAGDAQLDDKISDYISSPVCLLHNENLIKEYNEKYPERKERIIYSNNYTFFSINKKDYLFPHLYVLKNWDVKFNEIDDWVYYFNPK